MAGGSPRRPWWRRWFGSRSERAAERFLKQLGYRILARNYRCPQGEIDRVALDGTCLVFVEVRSTETGEAAEPAHSVGFAKQNRLTQLALQFAQRYRLLNHSARFDVLALSWPPGQKEPAIVHYRDAFPAVGRWQMYS
jgi:putative endonuclease